MSVENLTPKPQETLTSTDLATNAVDSMSGVMKATLRAIEQAASDAEARARAADQRRATQEAALVGLDVKVEQKRAAEAELVELHGQIEDARTTLGTLKAEAQAIQARVRALLP